jgi:hypothetical protein
MSNYIVLDGDEVKFDNMFGNNFVRPVKDLFISGHGNATIKNKRICVLGDEKTVSVVATYTSTVFPVFGTGTITISKLAAEQIIDSATADTAIIVVGTKFSALFTVSTPASNNATSATDTVAEVYGTGQFINSQSFVRAV